MKITKEVLVTQMFLFLNMAVLYIIFCEICQTIISVLILIQACRNKQHKKLIMLLRGTLVVEQSRVSVVGAGGARFGSRWQQKIIN